MANIHRLNPIGDSFTNAAESSHSAAPDPAGVTLSAIAGGGHDALPVSGPPTYYWANAVSGYFYNPANWRGGVTPTNGSDVILSADGGAPYTVTIDQQSSFTLNSIQIAANATLAMFGPNSTVNETFVHADNGGANAGVITVGGGSVNFEVAGTLVNSGSIKVTGTRRYQGYLEVAQFGASLTLSGGGKVLLHGGGIVTLTNSPQTLTNIDNTLTGSGVIGGGRQLTFDNQTKGVIAATGLLDIGTGTNPIVNAGTIEATGKGHAIIFGGVTNTGKILAKGANVVVQGNVGGVGKAIISGSGFLEIASSFGAGAMQAVSFAKGAAGDFKIDQAENFTGSVLGLATGDILDLGDINFVGATLSYAGTAERGTLTVTDGTTTAKITLLGDYTQANFALANDGAGHTDVTYNGPGKTAVSPPHAFVAALAALGAGGGAPVHTAEAWRAPVAPLAGPRASLA